MCFIHWHNFIHKTHTMNEDSCHLSNTQLCTHTHTHMSLWTISHTFYTTLELSLLLFNKVSRNKVKFSVYLVWIFFLQAQSKVKSKKIATITGKLIKCWNVRIKIVGIVLRTRQRSENWEIAQENNKVVQKVYTYLLTQKKNREYIEKSVFVGGFFVCS